MTRPLVEREYSAIYAIGNDGGPQKIGFSYAPNVRAAALSERGKPRLKVHGFVVVATSDARQIERLAHWMLRDKALGEERFAVTPDEATTAIAKAAERFYDEGARAPGPPRHRHLAPTLPQELLRRLEEWRAQQRPIPNKSEAARMLIEMALDAVEKASQPREKD
ncbi:GIY-YIG nuclease family protein [Methylobacterium komagatae]|uniref:GIY-YIG nuclease family protein n=1 Tax=Methylobacterium komagatae TaxID=374425 RepID=A0ABW2BJF3_9HYPH